MTTTSATKGRTEVCSGRGQLQSVGMSETFHPPAKLTPQGLIGLLALLACIASDAAFGRFLLANPVYWPEKFAICGLAWMLAQLAVASFWLAGGGINLAFRSAGVLLVLGSVAPVVAKLLQLSTPITACLLAVFLLAVAFPWALGRILNHVNQQKHATKREASTEGSWQISLAQLLGVTTAVAFSSAAFRHMQIEERALFSIIFFALTAATASLLPAWLLVRRRTHWRGWALAIGTCALLAYPAAWSGCPPSQLSCLAALLLIQGAATTLLLSCWKRIAKEVPLEGAISR